jgi:hypothetical protein
MERSAFAKTFRMLWIATLLSILTAICLQFGAAHARDRDVGWLVWLSVSVFTCTVLALLLSVVTIAGQRKEVSLDLFKLVKPIDEFSFSGLLDHRARALVFAAYPALAVSLGAPGTTKAVRSAFGSSSATLVCLLTACEYVCLALVLSTCIATAVLMCRAKRLKRQERTWSNGTGEETAARIEEI